MNQVNSNGASNSLFEHSRPNKPDSSRFDLSRLINLTADVGQIIPVDCFKVYPGDILNLDSTLMLDTLPLVQSSLTQYKIVTHWYYCKARDLWKGAKTQVTRGRTGNVSKVTPRIDLGLKLGDVLSYDSVNGVFKTDNSGDLKGFLYPEASHSLSSFIGVPPSLQGVYIRPSTSENSFNISKAYLPYTFKATNSDSYNECVDTHFNQYRYVNALPFVFYQSIVKNNYVNQNLLQNNVSLFPEEGDDDWILDYNSSVTNFIDYSSNDQITGNEVYSYTGVYSSNDTVTRLDQLRYAQFDDDYFTTGLPWLQRGEVSKLNLDTFGQAPVMFTVDGVSYPLVNYYGKSSNQQTFGLGTPLDSSFESKFLVNGSGGTYTGGSYSFYSGTSPQYTTGSVYADISQSSVSAHLTANELRSLISMSVWQERNARVNGSYNAMIYQHWLTDPNSEEHKPIYFGGSVDYLNFSNILQTSASTSDSPLGSTAGFGSSSGSSTINSNFRVDDYGYVMGVLIIKPVTYYQQGVEHFLSCEDNFEDLIQPEFQSLSPEPIYNKEIYVSGDPDVDNDLFAYQERYTYAKVRQNVNRGLFQVKPSKDILFGSFTQARWFDSLPKLSYQFLCLSPDNVRRDWLAYPSYPSFRIQFLTKGFVTRKLSYSSDPNNFGF